MFWQNDHWYPWILVHSWEKSQCKKYLSHYFLVDCRLIKELMYQIILLTWVSIFKQMSGDLSFEKKTQGSVLLLLCSGKCPHNRPSGHGYLLATDCKNHPIERLWISKQRLKAKCQNLITMDNRKSLMQRFMSDLRELFGLVWKELRLTIFFVCIVICLLRYYVYFFYVN